jgi:hypothetical protein
MRTLKLRTLAAAMVIAFAPAAYAATTPTSVADGPVQQLNTTGENKGQTQVATKIAASFGTLAGSDANTLKLVQALRDGTAVKLTTTTSPINTPTTGPVTAPGSAPAPTTGTGTTTTTTITPPTGKMGWGNVFISLALAKDSLARAGITNPTTAQLQAALTGGDVVGADGKTVTMKGILQMRADGMGWGQIAQASGTKLGPVVSSIKSAHKNVAALPASSTGTTTTTAATAKTKGVTTAGGTSAGSSSKGVVTAGGGSAGGKGVVTAAGGSAGGVTHGNSGNAGGKGVVNAGGGSAAGVTSAAGDAGGQGKGNAGGNGKGKGGG